MKVKNGLLKFGCRSFKNNNLPPIFVGGIFKTVYSTNGCIAVNGYVILIIVKRFYNRIRKRFLIKK